MKKILILANNDIGLYKFRKELIQKLLENHQVYISLPYGQLVDPLVDMGCQFIDTSVDRRGINPVTDLKLIRQYFRIFKEIKPDLVITYTIKPNVYGGFVSRIKHVEYAINITGLGTAFQKENLIKKLVCSLYKISAKTAKVVFFENIENKEIFIHNHLINEKQAYLLNGAGVNLEEYPLSPYPEQSQPVHFLFIGRVMKEKGVDELFEAAKRIKSQYPEIIFDIVGPMEDDYKAIISQLTAQQIIRYHGYQEDVRPFIKQCHCFVLPSYHEGMANTLLECASMGRPLITSDIHGCKEAINGNGYLCKVKETDDLYQKMKEFIELDYDQKKKLSINSRKHMKKLFDKEKVIEKTIIRLCD